MPHSRRGPRHHCPGAYGKVDHYPGNCRHNGVWCETHENYCAKHDCSYMKKWNCPACEKEERFNELRKDKERDDDEDEKKKKGKKKEKSHKQIAKAARQDKQAGAKKPKKKEKSKDGSKDGNEDFEDDDGSYGDTETCSDHDCFDSESVDAVPSTRNHADAADVESGLEPMAKSSSNSPIATLGNCKDRSRPLGELPFRSFGSCVCVGVEG